MNRRFFGTDGVRGRVGQEPINPETMLKLGWAAGSVLAGRGSSRGKVIIGKDTRVSGYLLESALQAGLSAAGIDISLLGPMPTPAIAYLTRTARARAGIVISASHNLYEDNGIKFFSREGQKLEDELEREIEHMMSQPMRTVASHELGKAERFPDAAGRYIEFCKSTIPYGVSFRGMTVVVDCANGAAYHVAPDVFAELGANVIPIANTPDGFNINLDCGSTCPKKLQQLVVELEADLGVALDGDADRVIMVDAQGECVDGDELLYIIAKHRKSKGALHGGVVGTLMSNYGLEQAFREQDIPFLRSSVGDRYVLSSLVEQGWVLGGESSGHIICLDKSTTGDGIIAALEVMFIMAETGQGITQLKQGMEVYPQTMINVRLGQGSVVPKQFDIESCESIQNAVRAAQSELSSDGRVVLRASGTEPVIRVMVEGRDSGQVARISNDLAEVVQSAAQQAVA
ncbi:MAG: phosphoglucosamine mutase [Gammaproteobacteria bacterium]|nr:phosphoglucosamine mutase [Gammaproteobacteria bacterium]